MKLALNLPVEILSLFRTHVPTFTCEDITVLITYLKSTKTIASCTQRGKSQLAARSGQLIVEVVWEVLVLVMRTPSLTATNATAARFCRSSGGKHKRWGG